MNTPKIRTVCVVGAAADVATRINSLLEDQRSHLDTRWRPAAQADADLLIIDADSIYGHMDWLKASSSGRRAAACTHSPEGYEAELWLRNPVAAADLVALLNRVSAQLGDTAQTYAEPAGQTLKAPPAARAKVPMATPAPAVPPPAAVTPPLQSPTPPHAAVDAPAAPAVAMAPPAPVAPRTLHLIDLLDANAPLKGRLRLAAEGLPSVLLDPETRLWHSASTLKALADWCTRALSPTDVQSLDAKEFGAEAATLSSHPYTRLQWLSHLVRGDGHLEPGLDVNAHYKLSRWPQSEREFPRHFRIATVMLKQASTLDDIATQAGATIADVANFVNAYHAIGYIDQESSERPQETANRGGLFGRMRKTSAN